jgi:hypothetical protein
LNKAISELSSALSALRKRFLKVLNVEVSKFNFGSDAVNKRLGNLFVEKIGFGICQTSGFKVVELLYKFLF